MKIQKFEDLLVWQKAINVTIELYAILNTLNDFGYKNQIQKAVISISNNLAEGFERGSDRDFKRFLFISQGSCSEVKSMLHLGLRLNYLSSEQFARLHEGVSEIGRMIFGLINSLTDGYNRKFRGSSFS